MQTAMNSYYQAMIDALAKICRIPSVRGEPLPNAPYGQETRQVLEEFLQLGKDLGFSSRNLDNRAGYVEFGSGEKLIAVLCHLDVVPAGSSWKTNPWELTIEDDRIIARGTIDDKGPAISVLFAMKALMDEGFIPAGRIRLVVGLDEESGSSCMEYYRENAELPDAGFTPDAEFPVIYAEKGIVWLKISLPLNNDPPGQLRLTAGSGGNRPNMVPDSCRLQTAGKDGPEWFEYEGISAHASKPWEGKNAISAAMADMKARLNGAAKENTLIRFYSRYIKDTWDGQLLGIACSDDSGPLTINAGQLAIEADRADLIFDMRYPVSADLAKITNRIKSVIAPFDGQLSIIEHQDPLYMPRDSYLVSTLTECFRQATGEDAKPKAIGGGTYARTMPNIVAFGPSFPDDPEMAHRAGEYISRSTLIRSAEIYRTALRQLAK